MNNSRKLSVQIVLLFIFMVVCFNTYSQDSDTKSEIATSFKAPDYEAIKYVIFNSESPLFYPDLINRYEKGDSTLTQEDYYYLYYGYSFDDKYSPYGVRPYADSIAMVLETNKGNLDIEESLRTKLKYYIEQQLKTEPFNINLLNILSYIYFKEDNIEKSIEYGRKYNMIKDAILSSGDGLTKKTPWHVLYNSDLGVILKLINADVTKRSAVDINTSYYLLANRYKDKKGVFFNTGRMWIKKPTELKEPKHRFEFNPTLNPRSKRFIRPN